jgi:hypothetical protein
VESQRQGTFEKRYVRPDGTLVPVRIHTALVRSATGRPLYFFTQVENISDRKRHEAELARRARQQETVARLGDVALRNGHLRALIDAAVKAVSTTLEVELCALLELPDGGEVLRFAAGVGWDDAITDRVTLPLGPERSHAAYAMASEQPVIVADLARETRFAASDLLRSRHVVSGLAVVVEARGHPFGALCAHSTRRRPFTIDDVNFVQAVANVISAAAERHRADEATRHAALHDELTGLSNRRLALDLIGQALRRRAARRRPLRCSWSTSTASRSSTIRWGTPQATSFCWPSPPACKRRCAPPTPWRDSAATSSSSSANGSAARLTRPPSPSPNESPEPSASP